MVKFGRCVVCVCMCVFTSLYVHSYLSVYCSWGASQISAVITTKSVFLTYRKYQSKVILCTVVVYIACCAYGQSKYRMSGPLDSTHVKSAHASSQWMTWIFEDGCWDLIAC